MHRSLVLLEVLARLTRERLKTIVLTARVEVVDRVRCFEIGAVDYVPKPFFLDEISARVRARLAPLPEFERKVVCWADAAVDLAARTVSSCWRACRARCRATPNRSSRVAVAQCGSEGGCCDSHCVNVVHQRRTFLRVEIEGRMGILARQSRRAKGFASGRVDAARP